MAALTDFRTKYPQYDNISDKDLADALHRKYYSDLDVNDYYQRLGLDQGTNYLELTGEMGKGVVRGFGSGLLSAGAGLAELADVGTDFIGLEDLIDSGNENELIRLANEGKQALNESLGVGDLYKDNYLVKLSEGLGSIGSFFVPGLGAVRGASLLGAGARGAGIAGTSATVGAGVGAGASEQADRVAAARARGEDVSAGQEDLAIALGGLIGSSEALAPLSILKKIGRFRDPVKSEEAFSAVTSMIKAGAFEGAQEVAASLAQSAVEDAVYSDEVTYGDTLWDDFTVGAGAGALLDAITTGVYRRRANTMRESEVEKEAALRASEVEAAESFYEDAERAKSIAEKTEQAQRKAEVDAVLEGDEAAFDAKQAAAAREEVTYDPLQPFAGGAIDPASMTPRQLSEAAYNYSNQLANNAVKSAEGFPDVGKFDVVEEKTPEGSIFKAVHSETGQQFGQPFREREGAIHLMANLNQQIFNRRVNSAVIDSLDLSPEAYTPKQAESLYVIGQKLNRPQTFSINAAVLNEAAGTVQSPSSPYQEDKTIDQLHTIQYGVPPYTDRGEKLYRPLSNLTAAQQINFERRKKGLREVEEFSLDEAKQVLGDKYTKVFDVLLGVKAPSQDQILEDFGTVGARLAKSRQEYQDGRRTLAEAKEVLVSKNIMSDVGSPEVKYIFEKIVGESDVGKMTPSQRMYLVNEIKKFPVVQDAVSLPDFRPKPYTRTQYNAAVRHVSETGDGTVENIESVLGDIGSTKRIRTVASALRKDIQKAGLINDRDEVSARPSLPAPAKPFVPEIKPYEEKVSEEAKNLEDALSNDLKGMGLDDIRVRVLDTLKRGPVTREGEVILTGRPEEDISASVEGFFKPASKTVFLGLDRINGAARDQTPEARRQALADILDHELVHGVRSLDLWTGKEWSLLEGLAKKKIVPGSGNVTFYNDAQSRYEDLNAVSQMEEAVADLIRYGRKDKKLITGKPRSLVERMYEFFERTGNALRGSGFQSFERGEIGARQRGEIRTLRALERGRGAVPERGIGLERDVLTDKQVFTGAGVTLPETEEEQIQASRGVEEREVSALDPTLYSKRPRRTKVGQYVGAPKELDSPQKLGALRRSIRGLALEGAPGRFWYEQSGKALLNITGGDRDEAKKLAQAIAITSPQTPVPSNFNYALQAYYQHKAGQPIRTGMFPVRMSQDLEAVFAGNDWEGRKTNNFYNNVMREIDATIDQGVTTDIWMMRAFGFTGDVPTDAQYSFVENEVKRIAEGLGWEPQQVQAAVWVAMKARTESKDVKKRTEKISQRKGYMKYKYEKDAETGKKKKTRVLLDPERHRQVWLNEAMKYDPTGAEKDQAKFDYSDAARNNLSQISWESIPGRTSGHLPEIFDAQYPEIQEYHVEISKAFLDEDGNDLVARELGILSPGDFEAPGFFEGLVSPGTQTQVVSPKRYKLEPIEFETEPAAEDLIKAYAAVRGILMKQDGVGYHRPFADKKSIRKGDLNGIEIDIGRPFTESETAEFARLMKEYSGHGEYNPIGSERGARLINFDYLIDDPSKEEISRQDGDQEKAAFKVRSEANNNFNNMVVKAVTAIDFENVDSAEVGRFAADSGYIPNDWSVDRNGESYIQSIGEISPDLQRRVEDLIHRLQPRIDAVDQNFSEKYGWTQNERINKNFKPRQDEVVYDALPDKGPQDIEREGIVESRRRTASEVANAFAQTSPPNTILGAAKRTPEVQNSIIEQEVFGEPMAFQTKGYTFGDKFIYQIADKFIGLKNVEAQINNYRRGLGLSPLKATESPYVGEESIAGIVGNKMRRFEEDRKRPLANKIANSGYSLEEVDEFLIMRHAIERNERIAVRDPERDVENNPGSGKLKTGQVLSNSFVKRKMKERYGLDWDSANESWVGGNPRSKKLNDIAADLDQIVNETLDTTVEGGLLDKDTAETIRGAYKYYAPMRGKDIEDDYAENVIVGSSLSTRGKEFLRAMGRESAAQSPLGHILLNAERAMTRAAKNKQFGERLVNLIRANPDEDFWRVISPEDPRYARAFEKKFTYVGPDKNLRGETFSEVPRDANKRDFVQRITLKRDNLTPGFDQDLIGVKLNGQQVYVELTDKRLRDAVVSMDAGTADNLIQKFSIVNRFLSMMNTSLNPEFVIGNFSRDVQTAIFNILGEQDMSQGKAKDQRLVTQVLKDVIPSMGVFYKGLRRGELKDGTFIGDLSGLDPKDQADFKEFMESGAKADWFHSRPPEEQVETVQSMVDMANGTFKGTFKRRFQQVMQFVEDSNSAVENAVRLATFKASRDELLNAGIPRQEAVSQAASLAKNLTVNFNRKGMAGDLLNSIYLFFNASVQGTANFARGLFGPNMNPLSSEASRVKQGAVSSLIMFGALAAARAEEESEENPESGRSYYSEIPDFVKERNIVIMADDGKNYYTIPLPYGYNVFHVLGQNLMEMKSGNISPTKAASNVTSAFLGSFSPIGFSSPAPTITQPFVELARNENFFGSPIYRENFPTGTQQPDSQLAMSTTRTPFKVIAKSLNAMISGNEQEPGAIDISPDTLEHLAEFALGGAGTFGMRNYDAFEKWQKGEELKVREIPFLRRIKGEPDERVGAADFYERKIKLEQKEARLDALRGRERLKYRRENSNYFKTLSDLDRAERRLRDLRKRRDRLKVLASRSPDSAVRFAEAEQRIYDLMNLTYNRFNKSYDRKVGRTK